MASPYKGAQFVEVPDVDLVVPLGVLPEEVRPTVPRVVAITPHARKRLANPERFNLAPWQQDAFLREQMLNVQRVSAAMGDFCQEWLCPEVVLILRVYNPTKMALLTCYRPDSRRASQGWKRKHMTRRHDPWGEVGVYAEYRERRGRGRRPARAWREDWEDGDVA